THVQMSLIVKNWGRSLVRGYCPHGFKCRWRASVRVGAMACLAREPTRISVRTTEHGMHDF
ncbi:MAG: hypothetical protein ABI456_07435, partial [Ktedonobacteraceae bacterium]